MDHTHRPAEPQYDDQSGWTQSRRPKKTAYTGQPKPYQYGKPQPFTGQQRADQANWWRSKRSDQTRRQNEPTNIPPPEQQTQSKWKGERPHTSTTNQQKPHPEDLPMKINVRKSCKANVHYNGYWFQPTEILRDVKIVNDHDTFLEKIFKEEVFGRVSLNRPDGGNMYLIRPTLTSLVRITKNEPHVHKPPDWKLCKIDTEEKEAFKNKYRDGNTLAQYSAYYVDNIFKRSYRECGLGENIEAYFTYKNEKYEIVPNYGEFEPFNPCIMKEFDNIGATPGNLSRTHVLIKEALQTLSFLLLIIEKDNVKFQSIFKFQGDKNTIEEIKDTIYDFYIKRFFFEDKTYLKREDIIIHALSDYKYKYVIFRFSLKDIHYQNYYVTLYNHYRMIEIDDLLRTPISYFGLLPKEDARDYKCYFQPDIPTLDFSYRSNQIIQGESSVTLGDLCGIRDFRVVNNFYLANRYHSYCSIFYLIQADRKYYEVSIKSVTFNMMKNQLGSIDKKYRSELNKLIKEYTSDSHAQERILNYDSNPDAYQKGRLLVPAKLPAILEVIVNEVVPEKLLRVSVEETPEDYENVLKLYREFKFIPSIRIIMELMFKAELRHLAGKDANQVMRKLLLGTENRERYADLKMIMDDIKANPKLLFFMLGDFIMTDNFLVNQRLADNNLVYLLTYAHNIKIELEKNKKDQNLSRSQVDELTQQAMQKIHKLEKLLLSEEIDYKISMDNRGRPKTIIKSLDTLSEDLYKYIKETTLLKLMWYVPKQFRITDVSKFRELIKYVNDRQPVIVSSDEIKDWRERIDDYSAKFFSTFNADKECIKLVEESTNFKEVYIKPGFLHTMRDLTPKDKEEIQEIVNLVDLSEKHDVDSSGEEYKHMGIAFHYPTSVRFSILHMHFYDKKYSLMPEQKRNYYNVLEVKMYPWYSDIQDRSYYEKDKSMPISIRLMLGDNYEDIIKPFKKFGRRHMMEKIEPELKDLVSYYSNIYKNI